MAPGDGAEERHAERYTSPTEAELVAQLDRVIESQLREIKRQLNVSAVD
jgi:hypothetical protein